MGLCWPPVLAITGPWRNLKADPYFEGVLFSHNSKKVDHPLHVSLDSETANGPERRVVKAGSSQHRVIKAVPNTNDI